LRYFYIYLLSSKAAQTISIGASYSKNINEDIVEVQGSRGFILEGWFIGKPADLTVLREIFRPYKNRSKHGYYRRSEIIENWITLLNSDDRDTARELLEIHRRLK